jgi:hypothetical protein
MAACAAVLKRTSHAGGRPPVALHVHRLCNLQPVTKVQRRARVQAEQFQPRVQFEGMEEEEVDDAALRAAEYFWWMARQDVSAIALTRDDLAAFLDSDDDVDFVFRLFDENGDCFVLVEEVQQRFKLMYRCGGRLTLARLSVWNHYARTPDFPPHLRACGAVLDCQELQRS